MNASTRPAWATETSEPDRFGEGAMHATTITVGKCSVRVDQLIELDGSLGPVFANLNNINVYADVDAQRCRDLAAALLKAEEIIDNTSDHTHAGCAPKITLDPICGVGLSPCAHDLVDQIDPDGVWPTPEAALEANPDAEAMHTQWLPVAGAEALGRRLITKAAELRSLTGRAS